MDVLDLIRRRAEDSVRKALRALLRAVKGGDVSAQISGTLHGHTPVPSVAKYWPEVFTVNVRGATPARW
ncbi:MAG: hypothetical protein HYX50_00665 [Chloroflexi bacterium]|nr:hypothetical protein [Chloroflexota bacterium]